MRVAPLASVAVLAVVGCGSSKATTRAESCADRFVAAASTSGPPVSKAVVRQYVLRAYCRRFAANGWVYADGALSIRAQTWLARGSRCSESTTGGRAHSVPCKVVEDGVIDCGMLRFVRRNEVRRYLAALAPSGSISCDDGTPLDKLGVP